MATFWWWLAAAAVAAAVIAALLVWLPMRRRRALLEQEAERLALRIQVLEQERDEQRRHLEQQGQQWRQAEEKLSVARAEQARLEERLAGQQDKLRFAEESREQLRKEFELLAGRIFEQRSRQFEEKNREGIHTLLQPFREQLTEFRRRVDQIHGDDARAQAALTEQLQHLKSLNQQMHQDARNLTDALRGQVKTQGNWGEMILERVLESSGLTKGREYDTQVALRGEDGGRRLPDAIVHLPEGKDVVIDAKVSLVAYERFTSAEDEEERRQAREQHLQSLRAHIKGLDTKDYSRLDGIRSLDFVLLFIPVEGAFMTAMEAEPGLYTEAYERNIVLVSPTTLLVTLRTIQNIWRYEYQNRNALDIADRAGRICDQVSLISESLEDVGDKLGKAQQAWETSYKRLTEGRGNLLGQAHKLRDLGAKARRNLPPPVEDEEGEDGDDQ
ncbi:DNA recombination protein RmuC [Alloalcanivorax xenomutans]|uniref:DNA recombination protein RmuC n=1 Tax=Alloalcanivorax xenomutans TaxID=1094342 RepID=UPI000BD4F6BC|nr:DNA recombination protein RmuC [Alloalcanivorax xenomutans]SOC20951.1 DNA recombination protein RmuC [Alloalcanivorax xenomutans]